MSDLTKVNAGKGFKYLDAAQGSPDWVAKRVGRITASRLKDWMAVGAKGQQLKSRTDYERELAYEMQFEVPYSRFTTRAMEEGTMMEEFVKQQYSSIQGVVVKPSGAFYNDDFAASPDGLIGDDGIIEVKWFYDNNFTDVLLNGVPYDYMLQVQGQLWASGRKWCDFVVGSGNAGKFKVIRVYPDKEIIKRIRESVAERKNINFKFDTDYVYDFTRQPEIDGGVWE